MNVPDRVLTGGDCSIAVGLDWDAVGGGVGGGFGGAVITARYKFILISIALFYILSQYTWVNKTITQAHLT
jgi:hypothetical protein